MHLCRSAIQYPIIIVTRSALLRLVSELCQTYLGAWVAYKINGFTLPGQAGI